jgi:hypothetical protein
MDCFYIEFQLACHLPAQLGVTLRRISKVMGDGHWESFLTDRGIWTL